MSTKDYLIEQNRRFGAIIEETFSSEVSVKLTDVFQFIEDLNLIANILEHKTDITILKSSITEYEMSFQAIVSGQYRFAFMGQRCFLEQICRFIFLSTNELFLRHWKLGLRDISWQSIIDKEVGIFSIVFIRAFFRSVELEGSSFLDLTIKIYRESSEFVHGNYLQTILLPTSIEINMELLNRWIDFMESIILISQFLLVMRFGSDFEGENKRKLQDITCNNLRSIDGFIDYLEGL